MSTITIPHISAMKGGEKIVVLSLYTSAMAELVDDACDIILVGDSLGMVLYGFPDTPKVTLAMMIEHGRAVARHSRHALVVIDMPYGTVEHDKETALKNCQKVMAETGAAAVKIEGGQKMAPTIAYITRHNIPVMGHVGLLPQQAPLLGGFKAQGLDKDDWQAIIDDATAIANAGAFSIVIECVAAPLAEKITAAVAVPTIGIGASPICDGQVLVADDMIGLTYQGRKRPRFVRPFADAGTLVKQAARHYRQAVRDGSFPNDKEIYQPKDK
ncbi:MAG: 3-methyl-2-oxobutanoate hydroxymethyltransferase [Alphaproteobacteria bacterium]|nr:3-methyl-2-oxobutanoate hydroxymethyltransferase [Alphaproteobacteria bacterium]